jgi:SAM-dependent methyltransferase
MVSSMSADAATLAPDEQARLAEWLQLERLPSDFPLAVHARDEMLPGLAVPSRTRPGRERLTYLRQGQEALLVLEHALAAHGRSLAAPARVLELACGYGRVTRHLLGAVEARRLTSCEIVPAAREFVERGLGVECLASQAEPTLVAWPGRFDVILVASLFSHLPRPRFEAWLAALRAASADDGLLVLSTHGLWLPMAPRDDGRGFAFAPDSESLTLSRAEYGTTCVAPAEVARLARQAGWAEVRWLERELWALQDVFVLGATPRATSAAPPEAAGARPRRRDRRDRGARAGHRRRPRDLAARLGRVPRSGPARAAHHAAPRGRRGGSGRAARPASHRAAPARPGATQPCRVAPPRGRAGRARRPDHARPRRRDRDRAALRGRAHARPGSAGPRGRLIAAGPRGALARYRAVHASLLAPDL